MKQPIYIKSACAISPQHSFNKEEFGKPWTSADTNLLQAIQPDHSQYISPVAIRRMSKLLKMGISSGMQCVKEAGINEIHGIITGTGQGSTLDMEQFLKDMIRLNEEALNPTYFIQSTNNSVNGWLAMLTKCTAYNQTYVHRGLSFDLALFDAMLMLNETTATKYLLVGGFDNMTDEYYIIKDKIGYWKKDRINSLELLLHNRSAGTIAGEGSAFVTVTNNPEDTMCALHSIELLPDADAAETALTINNILQANNLSPDDIDTIVCGMNGDKDNQLFFDTILADYPNATIAAYKHLCGEYDTASAFGTWVTATIIKNNHVPEELIVKRNVQKKIQNALYCNRTLLNQTTIMLLSNNQ
ncbi:MAG: beta-ketoacyl synthase chain length factor [Taibaiella sp.]|nr:beta-ketoacyl synthase chain length factor [Taibaiella sp.]